MPCGANYERWSHGVLWPSLGWWTSFVCISFCRSSFFDDLYYTILYQYDAVRQEGNEYSSSRLVIGAEKVVWYSIRPQSVATWPGRRDRLLEHRCPA